MPSEAGPLPYTDTKPHGHADFYLAINATFRFIQRRFGMSGLLDYWQDLGTRYYKPVSEQWRQQGLPGVASYMEAFFKAEPGGDVAVITQPEEVTVEVRSCPMISHLRANKREIVPCLCQHCYFVNEAIAAPAGLTVRIAGGNGTCTQRFSKLTSNQPPQNLADIHSTSEP